MAAEVSVVVTNYNTGAYLERCVASIMAQDVGGQPEVVVVENASFVDQEPHLRAVEAMGALMLRMPENLGHGRGCNRGFAASSSRFVFFANSDTRLCPGALSALVAHLDAHPEVGFVEPRTYLDDDLAFRIPELRAPTPGDATLAAIANLSPRFAMHLSRRYARHSLRGWRATGPIPQVHLTGAFLGARREVLARLGGYDEGYPLYYEDSDLFARARRCGLVLRLVPAADVVHYTRRSVAQMWPEAMAKSRVGRDRYMRIHHGRIAQAWDAGLRRLAIGVAGRAPRPSPTPLDLGTLSEPPTFAGAADGPWLLELAFDPYCFLSAGRLCAEPAFTLSERTWQSLYPTTYFVRALALDTLATLGAWRFFRAHPTDTAP